MQRQAGLNQAKKSSANALAADLRSKYNDQCRRCVRECKQSYRTVIVRCPRYISKRTRVETVVLLSKGEVDSKKVRVEFSLEDMDTSGFQQGATYGQIKEWVLERSHR